MRRGNWGHFRLKRGPYRRGLSEKGQLLLAVLLGLGLAVTVIFRFDAAVRPQLVALATTKLQTQLVTLSEDALEQAMAEVSVPSEGLIRPYSDPDGELTAFTVDTPRLNALRSSLVKTVAQAVGELDSHDLGVPMGALMGLDLFSAAGPKLPVRVVSVAAARGEYRNEFLQAGINQTLYRVVLDVEVTARLLLPGGVVTTELSTPVVVTEVLIVGQVPQTYVGVNK